MDNSWAKPGVKCVCINDKEYTIVTRPVGLLIIKSDKAHLGERPKFMHQYVVDKVHPVHPFISLVGIKTTDGKNMGWPVNHFRPLEEVEEELKQVNKEKTDA